MVTDRRFFPKGYSWVRRRQFYKLPKHRDPSRWSIRVRILPDEQSSWEGLGKTINAEFISSHLSVLKKTSRRKAGDTSMIDRLSDFRDAACRIRKALFAGEIVAYFVDERRQA